MPIKSLTRQKLEPYLFISPYVIVFLIFGLFPICFSLVMSFQTWSGMGEPKFAGVNNYVQLLTEDKTFWRSLWVTFLLLIFGSLSQHVIAIPLAIILNNKSVKLKGLFKATFFLPYITSAVSIALIFQYYFSEKAGIINYLIKFIGVSRNIDWLHESGFLMAAIAMVVNWRFIGWNTVIYLAGLQSIQPEILEAADIDGASTLTKHTRITLPLLLPIVFFAVTLSISGGMQLFDEPFVMTGGFIYQGGMQNNSDGFTSAYYIVWLLQRSGNFGKGSAVSWLLFIIVLIFTLLNKRIIRFMGRE